MPEAPLLIQRWYPFRGAAIARPLGVLAQDRRSASAESPVARRSLKASASRPRLGDRPTILAAQAATARGAASRTSSARCVRRRSATSGLVSAPESSNAVCARATGNSFATTRAPAIPRIRRRSCCAQIAPYSPVVAPAMATVLFRSQLPRCRAETQSIAFFKTPVVDPLYSGVTRRSASASSMRRRSSRDGRGSLDALLVEILVVVGDETEPVVHARSRPRRERARRPPGREPCYTTLPEGCRRSRGSSR